MRNTILAAIGGRKAIRSLALAMFFLLAGGCRHAYYVSAGVDPMFTAPPRTEAVFVTLPARPTIKERQLYPVLRTELCRNGFAVVDSVDNAAWVLALSFNSETREFGTETRAIIIPGQYVAGGYARTETITQTEEIAHLYLMRKPDFASGNATPVWEGVATGTPAVFQVYQPIIFDALLDAFGQNFDGQVILDKKYLKSAGPCPA